MPDKINVSAVICELNPLHLGHAHLFRQAKNGGALVCILSGNYVQRGEPAILDKWARARLALENGADLVLELPLPWACAGAERFAAGGVFLAESLGCVDRLVFGSETGDLPTLRRAAEFLLSPEFSRRLEALPDTGETFAKRREAVLLQELGPEAESLLRSSNDILALEYIKALLSLGSSIRPEAVLRQGAGHDWAAAPGEFRSASELRELLRLGRPVDGLVPDSTASGIKKATALGQCPGDVRRLERSILCKLRTLSLAQLAALPDVSEGLENRLYQAIWQAGSLEELYSLVKSKRYTHARIRRMVLHAFLGVTADLPALPPYLRVLAMNELGEQVLGRARPTLPMAARPADFEKLGGEALRLFRLEAQADDLYELCKPVPGPCGRDLTEKLIKPAP